MKRAGYYLVFATALISGVSIFMNQWAVKGLNPYLFTWSKNILVAAFLFSMILLMREHHDIIALKSKHWLQLVTIGLVGGSIPFLMFFKGLQMTSAASAAFIHKTMFVYVAIIAAFFLKERITKGLVIGGALLLAGNVLLLKMAWTGIDGGMALVFGATLLWAVENTISKYMLRELSSRVVAFGRMFFGSLFILAFLLATGAMADVMLITSAHLHWILLTGVFLLLYVTTWYEGLRTVNVSVATCILLVGSAITTSLQLLFLGKTVTLTQSVGMLLLVLGVIAAVGVTQLKMLVSRPVTT